MPLPVPVPPPSTLQEGLEQSNAAKGKDKNNSAAESSGSPTVSFNKNFGNALSSWLPETNFMSSSTALSDFSPVTCLCVLLQYPGGKRKAQSASSAPTGLLFGGGDGGGDSEDGAEDNKLPATPAQKKSRSSSSGSPKIPVPTASEEQSALVRAVQIS